MINSSSENKTGTALLIGGAIFTIIVFLWPIFMILTQPIGDITEDLLVIGSNSIGYILNFTIASLIAPSISFIFLILAFYIKTRKVTPILNAFGIFLLGPYLTLVSISYSSQYILLPRLIAEGSMKEARLWYFNNPDSIPYFINQLGYAFFALSALFVGFRFLFEKGLLKALGLLLWGSGILSVLAFFGLVINNELLKFSTIISGVLTIPIGIIVIIMGAKLRLEQVGTSETEDLTKFIL